MPVDAALGKDTPAADGPGPDNLSSIAKARGCCGNCHHQLQRCPGNRPRRAGGTAEEHDAPHPRGAHRPGPRLARRQRYRLDSAWFAVQSASAFVSCGGSWKKPRRPLISLHERTGATVHLAVLDGEGVLYLEKVADGSEPCARGRAPAQAHLPATCTAVGKALLAYADAATVRSIMSRPLPRLCGRSIVLPRLLNDQLRRCGGPAWPATWRKRCPACPAWPPRSSATAKRSPPYPSRGRAPGACAGARHGGAPYVLGIAAQLTGA